MVYMDLTQNQSLNMNTKTDAKALATLDDSYLKDNANIGLEDIGAEDLPTPTISIVQNNSTAVDEDGRPFPRGQFLYKGDNSIMKEVNCIFLSVSKTEFPDFNNKEEMVKTFVMLGVLEANRKPFLLYMKKTGAVAVRQFLGRIKFSGAPLFAHRVKLTTEEIKTTRGNYYVIKFNVLGLVDSMDTAVQMQELAQTYGSSVRQQTKEAAQPHDNIVPDDYDETDNTETVDPSDIPF